MYLIGAIKDEKDFLLHMFCSDSNYKIIEFPVNSLTGQKCRDFYQNEKKKIIVNLAQLGNV